MNEMASATYSCDTWQIDEPYPDGEPIPTPSILVEEQNYSSQAKKTIAQVESDRYITDVVQEIDDRGVL